MPCRCRWSLGLAWCLALGLLAPGCKSPASDPRQEAPPELRVHRVGDRNVFEVDRPERFRLARAVAHTATTEFKVTGTGTVNPDISRNNIGPVLDPNIRTAKVRIEVQNPGMMRPGMFVTATFHGRKRTTAAVPAQAILHLHDRDWVYAPVGGRQFRRVDDFPLRGL